MTFSGTTTAHSKLLHASTQSPQHCQPPSVPPCPGQTGTPSLFCHNKAPPSGKPRPGSCASAPAFSMIPRYNFCSCFKHCFRKPINTTCLKAGCSPCPPCIRTKLAYPFRRVRETQKTNKYFWKNNTESYLLDQNTALQQRVSSVPGVVSSHVCRRTHMHAGMKATYLHYYCSLCSCLSKAKLLSIHKSLSLVDAVVKAKSLILSDTLYDKLCSTFH